MTFLAFLPALSGQFVWDDTPNFVQNPDFRGLGFEQLKWMFVDSFRKGNYEPLNWLIFGLTYSLGGMNPKAYHLVGILLHVAAAGLFFVVARQILRLVIRPDGEQERRLNVCAAFAALLFSIHPLRVEVVAWVSGLHYTLAAIFFLACIHYYLAAQRTGQRRNFLMALAAFALSLLSFPIGMMLPFILLILDAYPLGRLDTKEQSWRSNMRILLIEKIPFFLLAGAGAGVMLASRATLGDIADVEQHGVAARLLVSMYGSVFYLWKTLLPLGLSHFYEMPRQISVGNFPFNLSTTAFFAIGAITFKFRRRFPAALAVWVFQLIVLIPVSGLAQSGPQVAADRYAYLSCLGWPLLLGAMVFRGLESPVDLLRTAAKLAPLPILICLCVLTWRQAETWHDDETLWSRVLNMQPSHRIANFNLGRTLDEKGRTEEAIQHYEVAAETDPGYMNPHFNLGTIYRREGKLDEAANEFKIAIRLKPHYPLSYFFLGGTLEKQGKVNEALDQYLKTVELDPRYEPAHRQLGVILQRQGRNAEAADHYTQALALKPNNAALHNNLGIIFATSGRADDAIIHFRTALEISPGKAEYHTNLGGVLRLKGELDEAIISYQAAARIAPKDARIQHELAEALALRTRRPR
ncbi:MAG: tetratricopeptide repeat protein [Elusimicrobiota bacterium]|nr:MAG: tetratricopeptide repeat protein [Elusimicrobiota bacterium]